MIQPGQYKVSIKERIKIAQNIIKRAHEFCKQRGADDNAFVMLDVILLAALELTGKLRLRALQMGDIDVAKTLTDRMGEIANLCQGLESVLEDIDNGPALILPPEQELLQCFA